MKYLLFLGIAFAVFYISNSVDATPDFCLLPEDAGEGTNFNFALWYDAASDQCTPFLYKGRGGNANRFVNERECIRNCSINSESLYPMDATEACHFKKAAGQCSGSFLRYYYDSVHDKCKKFLWTGCFGNGNRFFDFVSCNATCFNIHDDGTDEEEDEPDTPIAIICGVLLSIIIAAILITVILMIVQSKKKNSKKKAAGKSKEPKSEAPLQEGIEMSP